MKTRWNERMVKFRIYSGSGALYGYLAGVLSLSGSPASEYTVDCFSRSSVLSWVMVVGVVEEEKPPSC